MSYHQITIVGNVGGSVELRYTPSGVPVASFSVATNRRWKNGDGSKGEETVWYRISAWRRTAEVCAEYVHKGDQIMVLGRLKPDPETGGPRVYQRNDGSCGASFEVTANRVVFLQGGSSSQEREPQEYQQDESDEGVAF